MHTLPGTSDLFLVVSYSGSLLAFQGMAQKLRVFCMIEILERKLASSKVPVAACWENNW